MDAAARIRSLDASETNISTSAGDSTLKRKILARSPSRISSRDFPTPENIKNAAIEALRQNFTKYTPVSGTIELKQTICDYHKRTYGTSYSPKECIATIGTVLLLPRDAIISVDGKPTVFVANDATSVEPRAVTLGA